MWLLTTPLPGLLIIGGININRNASVEVYPKSLLPPSCSLDPLPDDMNMYALTTSVLNGLPVVCGGIPHSRAQMCFKLTGRKWQKIGKARWGFLREHRGRHSAHTLDTRILLVGGDWGSSTSEYADIRGNSEAGPAISPPRSQHCGLTFDDGKIILIGGRDKAATSSVTEMSGLRIGQELKSKNLPSLSKGRFDHSCGVYVKDDNQVTLFDCKPAFRFQTPPMLVVEYAWSIC